MKNTSSSLDSYFVLVFMAFHALDLYEILYSTKDIYLGKELF